MYEQDAQYAASSGALVAPAGSSLKTQFVDLALTCWLTMASEQNSCVCTMERGTPNPESAGVDEDPSADNQSAAVNVCLPVPGELTNHAAHAIAEDIAQQGRLAVAHGSSIKERHYFIMRRFVKYHLDKTNTAIQMWQQSSALICLDCWHCTRNNIFRVLFRRALVAQVFCILVIE